MLLRSLTFFLTASASALAQTVYDSAHNVTPITGTWSSGSMNVTTGSSYVQPNAKTFTFPTNTGISFSFDESSMWYEVLRYRMEGNGASPKCITVVLNWAHGQFAFNGNGSLTLIPLADGYQRIQEPCSANSDFTEDYHLQEMYQSWQIFLDAVDGPKFHLFAFDGSPEPPMRLLSQTPNMLPTQLLRNTSNATTTILKRSNNDVVVPATRWWSFAAVATISAMLGSTLLI